MRDGCVGREKLLKLCELHRPHHHAELNNQVYKPLDSMEAALVSSRVRSIKTAATRVYS
jgi:hypothetical protein